MILQLDSHYQALSLSDGSILFDNIYGRHFRLKSPSELQRYIIDRLEEGSSLNGLLAALKERFGPEAQVQLEATLEMLRTRNALATVLPRRGIVERQIDERFSTFVAWLSGDAGGAIGRDRFERLRQSSLAFVGLGGAGSLCAMMFAAAGIGKVTLIDGDFVETGNLVRQLFYTVADAEANRQKAQALEQRIKQFSGHTEVRVEPVFLDSPETADRLVEGHDMVLQTADEPPLILHRWIAQACVRHRVSHLYSFVGQIGPLYVPDRSACFGCLENTWRSSFPYHDLAVDAHRHKKRRQPPSVVSAATQTADFMFTEALSFLINDGEPLTLRATAHFRKQGGLDLLPVQRDVNCQICGSARRRP